MKNYQDLGLTPRLRSTTSLLEKHPDVIKGVDFEMQYDVQVNRLNTSKINIENLIKLSNVGTALGTFSSSQTLSLTTTLSYVKPHANERIFGMVYIALYQGAGTASADQIYPARGANVTLGRYDVQGMYDIVGWNNIQSRWRGLITDTNGTSTQAITLQTQWWHIDNRSSGGE